MHTFEREHRLGSLPITRVRLDNGLAVVLVPDPSAEVVSVQVWFAVGSRHERPGKTGIAHLFEHLMFNQTKHLPAGEFDRLMESAGGDTNAATWVDWTYYRDSLPATKLDLGLRLEAERMQFLTLDRAQVESEIEVVQNERRFRVEDDVDGFLAEQLFRSAFTVHPYGWPTIGWMQDIANLTLDDCRDFYRRYYAPNNANLILVGDFAPDDALGAVVHHFGHIAPGARPDESTTRAEPEQTQERRHVFRKPVSTEHALLGYKCPGQADSDWLLVEFVHELLFGGASSRLYKRLVIDEEIASSAGGHVAPFRDPGLYEIDISAKRERSVDDALRIVDEEIARLETEPPSADEMRRAKSRMETGFWSSMETADGKAESLGHYETTLGDFVTLFDTVRRIDVIGAEDVTRAAARYLRPSQRTVVVAVPDGDAS